MHKDDRSYIVETDSALQRILGWGAEEMRGRRSLEFIHPADHSLAVDNWMQMLARPGPARRVRLRHRTRENRWVWFEVTNHNLLEDPDQRCVVSEMVDISDEMAVQEALTAREQLLARIAATIPVGLFQADRDGQITYTNDRLHEILSVERAPTLTAQFVTVVDTDRITLANALDRVLHAGSDADIEVRLCAGHSRELRYCTIGLRALRHDDGRISGAIGCVADVTDGVLMREELTQQATFDELTGCYNRSSIIKALEMHIASAGDVGDLAVMFVDLDHFKATNDHHGHAVGDELLRWVAGQLGAALRRDDLIGRIGGDEFLVMCPDLGDSGEALHLAERLAQAVSQGQLTMSDIEPRVSIGVACSRGRQTTAEALVARADQAMYESKSQAAGRPRLAAPSETPPRLD
jgi:diguanylate cyclase (GGDEF)-like protein/PAS domain S-box-containing protein